MDTSNTRQGIENTDTSPPSPPPWPSSPPDALSLYGIARRYCRERILVEPLRWTNRQLELLRISFSEPSLAPLPSFLEHAGERAGLTHIKDYYDNYHEFYRRVECVQELISGRGTPLDIVPWGDLQFLIKQIPAAIIAYDYMYPRYVRDRLNSYPIATYIDREFLEAMREESFHLSRRNSANLPVLTSILHQLKKIKPANPLKDPYIAALMIALAQNLREHILDQRPEILPELTLYSSYALTSFESAECIHLFKADLPSSLLDMFQYPTLAPAISPPVTIQVFTIPLEPALTFRDRLFALIVPTTLDQPNKNKRKMTSD